jgi:hypothetical protein
LNHGESGHTTITVGEAIRTQIVDLRKFATAAIGREGKDPSRYQAIIEGGEFADRAYCAALILKNLDDVEISLVDVEEWGDRETDALFLALECAYYLRLLTITDHEQEIVTGRRTAQNLRASSSRANAARRKRHSSEWARWNIKAAQIWQRHPKLSRQAVAGRLKSVLKLGEDVRTIAKRLNKPGMAG